METVLHAMETQIMPVSGNILCSLLQECTKKKDLRNGRRAYTLLVWSGLHTISFHGDLAIRFFATCGFMQDAYKAFCRVVLPTIYTWNSVITASVKHGDSTSALRFFTKMQTEGIVPPDNISFSSALKSCCLTSNIDGGMLLHGQILENGLAVDSAIGNTLVDMYGKCGHLKEAQRVFDHLPCRDVISWGAIIGGYASQKYGHRAWSLFCEMRNDGIAGNDVIFLCIMKACCHVSFLRQGKIIHDQILRTKLEHELPVGSALVDMYVKCGVLTEARKVFENLSYRNIVAWGAMIGGYAQQDCGPVVLELFVQMEKEGTSPNTIILLSVLKACVSVGALILGRLVHYEIIETMNVMEVVVGSTIVDMYARCGSMEEAQKVFTELPEKNVVTWGSLVAGYAQCGNCGMIEKCLAAMQSQGFKPDDLIFTGILSACCQAALIEQGLLQEAEDILQTMPRTPDTGMWRSLLTNCRAYGNKDLGGSCLDQAVHEHSRNASSHLLSSNACSGAFKQMHNLADEADELEKCSDATNNLLEF